MRIVMMSDTHNWEIKREDIPDGDILIHAGDATGEGSYDEVNRFYKWFGAIKGFKHKIYVPGNHDWLFDTQWGYANSFAPFDVTILNDSGIEIDGVKFWGSPVTPYFFGWAFNRRDEEIQRHWDYIPDDTNVLITHGPILGVGDMTIRGEHVGCPRLGREVLRLQDLQLHVFGHIHYAHGMYTRNGVTHVNAAICDERYRPTQKVQVIDL